jgi:cell division protein FtsQ
VKKKKIKPAPLRRSKPSLADWIRRFWVLAIFALFALAYGAWLGINASYFRVKHLEVSGLHRVTRGEVSSHAQISARSNIWLFDTGAIARRVEAIPYVLTARVHRALPATVRLEVTERIPDGCVRTDDGAELTIDATRRVLERGCLAAAVVYLPRAVDDTEPGKFIDDTDLAALQKDARILAASGEPLTDFSHDKYGQLEARLADGIRIRFGDEEDLERKRRLIGPVLASIGNRLAGVTAIDLRAPGTPVVERK